jgi:integrase
MAGQIIPRGERTWLVRVFLGRGPDGKRRYLNKTVRGTKKDAGIILRELLTKQDRGHLTPTALTTVDEFLTMWLSAIQASVRPRTHFDYTYTLAKYVRPHIGKLPVRDLTSAKVSALVATLSAGELSPRTIRKPIEILRNAMEHAVMDKLLDVNPVKGRLVQRALPRVQKSERETIGLAELPTFLAAVEHDRMRAYFVVLLFGGFRPEEALALRWQDINGDTVSVHRVLVDRPGVIHQFGPPKSTSSRRAVVLPDIALKALQAHRKLQAADRLRAGADWQDLDLIFTTATGGPLRQHVLRKRLGRLLKAAGLPPMRVYDLRHSMASLLLELGEDIKVVQERMGHSSITLTADTYAHVSRGMQQRAADKLNSLAV